VNKCPHCSNEDNSLIEQYVDYRTINGTVIKYIHFRCEVCSKSWNDKSQKIEGGK
jgi:hypothetical protein